MRSSVRWLVLSTVVAIVAFAPIGAQSTVAPSVDPSVAAQAPTAPTNAAPTATSAGPRRDALSAGFRDDERRATRNTTEAAQKQKAGLGTNTALMIVGVAALLVGAIVGGTAGTLIMVGGAVFGLIGLYQFLQ